MDIECPSCGSLHVLERNIGQKTFATLGGVTGAISGVRTVLYGGRLGMMIAGPGGLLVGCIFGALAVGSIGCEIGSEVGKQIDQSILNNYLCCTCDCAFSKAENNQSAYRTLPYQAA